jgi:hypothetical protein
MCFGERTTFVCPACENKSWETKWYTFSAEAGECALGELLGSCTDPYMAYHQEYKYCVTCLIRLNDDQHPPQSPPETFHPDDHDHEHPELLHYEASELRILVTTGELTGPMRVARELNRQSGSTSFYAAVPETRLMYEISSIIRNRNAQTPDLVRIFEAPALVSPRSSNYPADDVNGNTIQRPTTPVQPSTRSRISGSVFEGLIPPTALYSTPLPSYDQAVSRGQALIYSEFSRENIPINRRRLERVANYSNFFDRASGDLDDKICALDEKRNGAIERYPAIREIFETLDRLDDAETHVLDEAMYRDRILFRYNTTSATEQQTRRWMADITRNPENSVRSHIRRFSEWINLIEAEYSSAISTNGASLPGGSLPPARRAINLIFQQEETRDQMRMQGDEWAGLADAWITPSEDEERIVRRTRRRDRRFPEFYNTDDAYDNDYLYPDEHPLVESSEGRYVQIPDAFGIADPDMMDID